MSKPTVFVEDTDYGIISMFEKAGWERVYKPEDADYVVFSGGADVSPSLYGQDVHKTTRYDSYRDEYCVALYEAARERGQSLIGICRGAQFLNVMNGGTMFQHVNNHTRDHFLFDIDTERNIMVTSTHHQMMIPHKYAQVLAYAYGQSTQREYMVDGVVRADLGDNKDTEVVWYDNCLCFQPHPEYGMKSCHDYFFELIERTF